MRLEDVLAPVAPKEFIDRYLSRDMLVVSGARRRFAHLLPWDDLNAALNRLRVGGPRMRLFQQGKSLDARLFLGEPHPYGSPVRGAELERLLAAGATLVLDKVDELFPAIRELTDAFEKVFRIHVWANLYAGWRTQNGFDLHFDGHDTMILQVHGRKHWKVYRPTRLHPFKDGIQVVERPVDPPAWEGVLEDGGVLYMPRGWWHVACPLDEASLHLTVGLAHPTGAQMLEWLAAQLTEHVDARMDVPHLKSAEEQRAWTAAMRTRIMNVWSDDVIDRFMAFQDTVAVARPDIHLPVNAERHVVLTPETRLRLASGRRLHFADAAGNEVSFIVQEKQWTCEGVLVPALARLNHLRGESIADLCAAVPSDASTALKLLLSALAMRGVVSVEPEWK